jgi:hypothetical protein
MSFSAILEAGLGREERWKHVLLADTQAVSR